MEQSRSYPANPAYVAATSPTASQSSHATAHTNNTTTNKKRKTSGNTGSRGVANLTPEQLRKKRANDREAQRANRERTKERFGYLENRIKELTDQKPYQELQDVIRQKEVVEAQNEDIKRRLTNVMSILQPLCGLYDLDPSQPQYAGLGIQHSILSPEASSTRYSNQPPVPITVQEARSVGSTSSTYAPSPQARNAVPSSPYTSQPPGYSPAASLGRRHGSIGHHPVATHSPVGDEKLELGYLLRQSRQTSGEQRLQGSPHGSVERTPPAHSLLPKPAPTLSPFQNGSEDCPPVYAYPPKTISQTCPLDGLLLKFLSDQRERLFQGEPIDAVIGPPYPSFRTLIDPRAGDKSHALSKVFTDMLEKFPDISTLPEQAAILFIMFIVMRWQIHPTQDTYDRLPDWMTPRPSQLFTPHPAWVDHLPWPRMRDKLTRIYPTIPFDEFFIPYTTTVSLNWPYDDQAVLMSIPNTEELTLTPLFERHLMDLGNWSLGDRFARAHPQLADTFKMGVPKNKHI